MITSILHFFCIKGQHCNYVLNYPLYRILTSYLPYTSTLRALVSQLSIVSLHLLKILLINASNLSDLLRLSVEVTWVESMGLLPSRMSTLMYEMATKHLPIHFTHLYRFEGSFASTLMGPCQPVTSWPRALSACDPWPDALSISDPLTCRADNIDCLTWGTVDLWPLDLGHCHGLQHFSTADVRLMVHNSHYISDSFVK